MEFQNVAKCFRQNQLHKWFLSHEQKVKVVCLIIKFIERFCDYSHDLANTLYLFNQSNFAREVYNIPYCHRFQKQHLINSQQFRTPTALTTCLGEHRNPREVKGLPHKITPKHLSMTVSVLALH